MLDIDLGPAEPIPPAFAKQIRYYDAFGKELDLIDVTDLWNAREKSHGDAPEWWDRFAKESYPEGAARYACFCFWPCDGKWVVTSRHDRIQERLAVAEKRSPAEAAQARRFARMMQGKDRL